MAKSPRHKRMYSDSPKLERGESGKMEAKKPSEKQKEADKTQSGDDGMKTTEPHEDARMQEIVDMHKRHETEMKAIHGRHSKEDAKKYAKTEASKDNNESEGAGDREIEEVRKGKEITE